MSSSSSSTSDPSSAPNPSRDDWIRAAVSFQKQKKKVMELAARMNDNLPPVSKRSSDVSQQEAIADSETEREDIRREFGANTACRGRPAKAQSSRNKGSKIRRTEHSVKRCALRLNGLMCLKAMTFDTARAPPAFLFPLLKSMRCQLLHQLLSQRRLLQPPRERLLAWCRFRLLSPPYSSPRPVLPPILKSKPAQEKSWCSCQPHRLRFSSCPLYSWLRWSVLWSCGSLWHSSRTVGSQFNVRHSARRLQSSGIMLLPASRTCH